MRILVLTLFLTSIILPGLRGQSLVDPEGTERVTTAGNIGLTVTNIGIVGNSFRGNFTLNGWPSCEFPRGSGIEHMFEGGFWTGGLVNGQKLVTSGAIDAVSGYSPGAGGFEFTSAVGGTLEERSSLFDSPNYDPNAISHQDFYSDFSDTSIFVPGTSIQINGHDNPLGLAVHFETYNWNYSFANFFVILNFTLTNVGNNVIDDPYLGYWLDGVIRNVNITFPSGSAFFNKGGNGYLDSLYMGYEFDAAGDVGFTDSYLGLKFLGAEDKNGFHSPYLDSTFKVNYQTWQFRNAADPLYFFPDNDNQAQYDKMSTGLNYRGDFNTVIRPNIATPSNRSTLVAAGPFAALNPGESINIAFALVCARKNQDGNPNADDTDEQKANLITNALWAQTAFNGEDINANGVLDPGEDRDANGVITRYILPSPPDIPNTKFVASDHQIDVYWTKNAESSIDPISNRQDFEGYRLYKSTVGFDIQDRQDIFESLKLVAEFDKEGNGLFFDNGFQEIELATPDTINGIPYYYKYSFENLQNGWQHAVALTAFDEGDEVNNLESLESASLSNMARVFPGKPSNTAFEFGDPYVYPNPYYAGAAWEGSSSFEEDRKIIFANLPRHCMVRIYTVAGDFVDSFEHTSEYSGEDIRWYETYSDRETTAFSGGEHAWDLLSKDNQIIARGIYLFAVEDLDAGKNFQGKFVVIK